MDIYSSNTSDMIRYDFVKFSRRDSDALQKASNDVSKAEEKISKALEDYRAELSDDDGLGTYGSYKCPIF